MNPIVFHVASGQAFFSGITLLLISAASSMHSGAIYRRVTTFSFLIGMISIVISSTAIPYWYYGLVLITTTQWMVSFFYKRLRRVALWIFVVSWIGAGLLETPFHFVPKLKPTASRKIAVIGDSVTAGVGSDERSETWPKILAREHELDVQDISHVGEDVASALKRAKSIDMDASIIVVEIGGNDIFGATNPKQFERNLDELLRYLSADDRQIIMFELPLPPFYHEYGRIQRKMAAAHKTKLIPKRVLLSVVADSHSTLDSIHLTQSGHQMMADRVWEIIGNCFSN